MKKASKGIFSYSALAVAAITLWAGGAQAANTSFLNTTNGLYSTGVNASGGILVDNNTDSHYTYAASTGASAAAAYAAIGSFSSNTVAVTSLNVGSTNDAVATGWAGYNTGTVSDVYSGTGASITSAGTVANTSTWVSTNTSATGISGPTQYYTYRTTFDLTGFNLNSIDIQGLWASDGRGKAIYLNGTQIATIGQYGDTVSDNANYGVNKLASFSLASYLGLLSQTTNTLDFVSKNGNGPSQGTRVQFTTAEANSIPEPSSLALLSLGLVAFRSMRKRKI